MPGIANGRRVPSAGIFHAAENFKNVEIQNRKRISNLTVTVVSSAIRNTYYTTVDIQILDKPITAQYLKTLFKKKKLKTIQSQIQRLRF